MFVRQQNYSGSYNFAPSAGEIILAAFQRVNVRPTEILTPHIQSAVMELNLVLARFNVAQPNLWTVDLQALPLIQGQETYSLPAETVQITNAYIRTGSGQSTIDRMIFPISQTEYSAIANKNTQAPPTQFWYDRTISPTITLYPVPDGNGPYTLYYYRVRQVQDAVVQNGYNVEIPVLWMDALVAGLAYRLARIYAPQLEQARKQDADEAWFLAAGQDVENVPMNIIPGLGGYWR